MTPIAIVRKHKENAQIAKRMQTIKDAIFDYIKAYRDEHGFSPSIRELSLQFGKSTSMIRFYLDYLEWDGRIERSRGIARTITIKEQ